MTHAHVMSALRVLQGGLLAGVLAGCGASPISVPHALEAQRLKTQRLKAQDLVAGCASPTARVNFQPTGAAVPAGYGVDDGSAYSETRGWGWVREDSLSADSLSDSHVPLDLRLNTRDRNRPGIDQRQDTLIHMQYAPGSAGTTVPGAWEYKLPAGHYCVTVSVGDGVYDSLHTVNVEGTRVIDRFAPRAAQEYRQASAEVDVTDGRLTIDARGGGNTKLNFVDVTPITAGSGTLVAENLDGSPFADRLVFNRISTANFPGYGVHNLGTVRLRNTGSTELSVSALNFSGPWALESSVALPARIPAGGTLDVPVRFVATSGDGWEGSLTVSSNDPARPDLPVQLAGFWQSVSEGGQEPSVQELLDVFGYEVKLVDAGQQLDHHGQVEAVGEEVLSPYWRRADTSKAVQVRQIAAFHTQGQDNTLRWYAKGSESANFVMTQAGADSQSVLPRRYGLDGPAAASFAPGEVFGFKVEGEWSDPTRNDTTYDRRSGCTSACGHHLRFWPLRERSGTSVPDTYLMLMDSLGVNDDYNDDMYVVSNIRPE